MSNLDDELAKAIRDSEKLAPREGAEVAPGVSRAPAPPPARNVGLLISLLVMGTAVVAAVMMVLGGKEEATYARTPGQVSASREELTASKKSLRVQGNLVSGSLRKRDKPCEYRFSIEGGGGVLEVHYPVCIVPDTFRDVKGMPTEVTAEGNLSADGHLDAKNVLAKCPSKYDMDQMKATGRQMEQVPIRTVTDFENN
jgi:cytochrome c-type biogenesis protein CcmE